MLAGIVVRGDGMGKGLGYPTANLNLPRNQVMFAGGVYAATAKLDKREYRGALVINQNPWKIEIYLFDYLGPDFYGSHMSVTPIQKVSEIEQYDSLEELKQKIEDDIVLIRDFFAEKKL